MNRRRFFSTAVGSAVGLSIVDKAKAKPELHKKGCSYCGEQEFTKEGQPYIALSIDLYELGGRRICTKCIVKVFDKVLNGRQ